MPELITEIQSKEAVQAWLSSNVGFRIETSGHVTCVDMTPNENPTQK